MYCYYYVIMIPIEIINKILLYVGELNNNMIITQYHLVSNKEYYKINFYSDLIWKIKATIRMKKFYPIYNADDYLKKKGFIELYKFGTQRYKKQLQFIGK